MKDFLICDFDSYCNTVAFSNNRSSCHLLVCLNSINRILLFNIQNIQMEKKNQTRAEHSILRHKKTKIMNSRDMGSHRQDMMVIQNTTKLVPHMRKELMHTRIGNQGFGKD